MYVSLYVCESALLTQKLIFDLHAEREPILTQVVVFV